LTGRRADAARGTGLTSLRPPASRRRRRIVGTLVATISLTLAITGSVVAQSSEASAPVPAGVSPSTWAWVVARQPGTHHYTPAAVDRGNSAHGINTVTRNAKGDYRVDFGGILDDHGVIQVTALSSGSRLCISDGWGGAPLSASVLCFTGSGDAVDSAFSISYLRITGGGGTKHAALLWADQQSSPAYTPDTYYNYDSWDPGSIYNQITRQGDGKYTVTMPNIGANHGDVQVVAYTATAACRVATWDPAGLNMMVKVRCLDIAGAPVDTEFDMTYTNGIGLAGYGAHVKDAYLWADRPTATSYHPASAYRFSSAGTTPTIKRTGTGHYEVILPGMPKGGAAQVTSYGGGSIRCNLSSIRTSGLPQTVGVRCYDVAGHAKDGYFTLAYLR
jgi:hypothetical protein